MRGANPADCICRYVHCSDPNCRSKAVSNGAVSERDRAYPVEAHDIGGERARILALLSTPETVEAVAADIQWDMTPGKGRGPHHAALAALDTVRALIETGDTA